MNKTIQISGQTIELPFTEAEYQKIIHNFQTQGLDSAFSHLIGAYGIRKITAKTYLAIGLHLAEKAREDEIDDVEAALEQMEMETEIENTIATYKKIVAKYEARLSGDRQNSEFIRGLKEAYEFVIDDLNTIIKMSHIEVSDEMPDCDETTDTGY